METPAYGPDRLAALIAEALALADELELDLVAIRLSEAQDMLTEDSAGGLPN
jgi:hypothetical protein